MLSPGSFWLEKSSKLQIQPVMDPCQHSRVPPPGMGTMSQELRSGHTRVYLLKLHRMIILSSNSSVTKAKKELALLSCPWDDFRGRFPWKRISKLHLKLSTSHPAGCEPSKSGEDGTETIQLELCSTPQAAKTHLGVFHDTLTAAQTILPQRSLICISWWARVQVQENRRLHLQQLLLGRQKTSDTPWNVTAANN